VARNFLQCGFGIRVITGEFEVRGTADERRKAGADALVIIHDGNFNLHVLGNTGNHTLPLPQGR